MNLKHVCKNNSALASSGSERINLTNVRVRVPDYRPRDVHELPRDNTQTVFNVNFKANFNIVFCGR